ncbi:MAG TPA: hypothetical protein VMT59_06065, partial [Gaiellaceae bacterium]|nr:hypothetical protein [Gaiellaceae bacterium]
MKRSSVLATGGVVVALALIGGGAAYGKGLNGSPSATVTMCADKHDGEISLAGERGCGRGESEIQLATAAGLNALTARVTSLESSVATLQTQVATLQSQNSALQVLLAGVSRPSPTTILFKGVNLQLVDGLGSTTTQNGTGNLIIGYDEGATTTTGSHYLVLGTGNSYSSWAAIV